MKANARIGSGVEHGFSLIELLIVITILMIVMASVFQVVVQVQTSSRNEEVKLDMLQQARETMDQMMRDLRQSGYPAVAMYSSLASPVNNSTVNAVGLVKIINSTPEITFEGDVDGDGQVDSVRYRLVATSTESTRCPCIERSQVAKTAADPLSGQGTDYHVLVENVATGGLSFAAYDNAGAAVTIPAGGLNITNNASAIASIKTIRITISARGQSPGIPNQQSAATALTVMAQIR